MDEVLKKLEELLTAVKSADVNSINFEVLIDARNKLNLYIQKFFNSKLEYIDMLKQINTNPHDYYDYNRSLIEIKSLITTLIQDIQLNEIDYKRREDEINRQTYSYQRVIEEEREKILKDSREIDSIKEDLLREKERLLLESEKFNEFKTKLEFADKNVDFQSHADNNKKKAIYWAIAASAFIMLLLIILCNGLEGNDKFSTIAQEVKNKLLLDKNPLSNNMMENTIYFTYAKFIFTKLLLYSLLLYAIGFCVKNYNAQMHNHVINSHKANAFKSTISLLNTAKSEDGNDKLLVQATQAIFAHQQTGYNGKGTEQPSPNLVTNVIDGALKKV